MLIMGAVLLLLIGVADAIRCQDPSDPNLKEQLPNQWMGDYAQYRCREGFTPTDRRATCTENGWSPKPLCEVIPPCNLPTVENADIIEKIQEVYNHGAAVTYACRTNYRMKGERTIRCQSGQWSPRTPICIGVTCQLPQLNGNTYLGVIKERFLPGETVRVKCNQGHWFSNGDRRTQKTITCTGSGEWHTAIPHNIIFRHQLVVDVYIFLGWITLFVFQFVASSIDEEFNVWFWVNIVCALFFCFSVIPPCNSPTTVENAVIIGKKQVYNHGATVNYACRTNYRMEGERTIRCQNGQWSPRTPTCIEVTCRLPQLNGNTYLDVNKDRYVPGETVLVKCNRDRCFSYDDQRTQKTITCTGSGEWDSAAICQEIRCQDPNDPHLKEQLESRWMDGYAPYRCKEGFKPTHGGRARCTENGWTPNPLCQARCYLPTTVANSDIIGDKREVYNHGAAVTYACHTNYRMEGERTIRCQSGQWSPRTPTCIGVKTFCDATQPHITTQCFGSLGGTVELLLPKTSQDDIYKLKKNNVTVNNRSETTDRRYSFIVSTGIFTIKDVNMKDTGEYSMEVHDAAGMQVAYTKCYLTIEVVFVTGLTPFIVRPLTVVLLLLAALGVYWALKKKKTSRPRDIALSSMAVDDDVPYVNVSGTTGRAGGE
ncbi:complement factor H-related protein 5-like isoform X2 [Gadus chalcogrammus]|uniref:complement factor H-related protein 5-like isoform X2 n=1 Tax=Gadus chalcogrammus TaxID=1042646 RepID=UPI0024C47C32|nr:complement factor H-related protein 5-like isoform X2 [Gadus chalcogrammus]